MNSLIGFPSQMPYGLVADLPKVAPEDTRGLQIYLPLPPVTASSYSPQIRSFLETNFMEGGDRLFNPSSVKQPQHLSSSEVLGSTTISKYPTIVYPLTSNYNQSDQIEAVVYPLPKEPSVLPVEGTLFPLPKVSIIVDKPLIFAFTSSSLPTSSKPPIVSKQSSEIKSSQLKGYYGMNGSLEEWVPKSSVTRIQTRNILPILPVLTYLQDPQTGESVPQILNSDPDDVDPDPNYGIEQEWLLFQRQGDQYDRIAEWREEPDEADAEDYNLQGVSTLNDGYAWGPLPLPTIPDPLARYGYDVEYQQLLEYQQNQDDEDTGKYED